MSELRYIIAIAYKDLLQEARSKAVTVATLFFSAIVVVILAFAIGPNPTFLSNAAPGVMWVALAFAGIISSGQSYQAELEESAFEQLLLYPLPRAAIYLGKLLSNWLFMMFLGIIILPITSILFGGGSAVWWPWLLATIFLGTLGFSLITTFYGALTANLRARESLLPVLMFPIVVPVILAAVRATGELMHLGNLEVAQDWLKLLLGFDLVYLVVCTALFGFLVEE